MKRDHGIRATATRETLDQGRAFQVYCLFGGKPEKTAVLCNTSPEVIKSLAHNFCWNTAIRSDLSDPTQLKTFREQNRMAQYVVAEKARELVSALIPTLLPWAYITPRLY